MSEIKSKKAGDYLWNNGIHFDTDNMIYVEGFRCGCDDVNYYYDAENAIIIAENEAYEEYSKDLEKYQKEIKDKATTAFINFCKSNGVECDRCMKDYPNDYCKYLADFIKAIN